MRMIVGCGSLDRGDDAAGILVVRRLRELGVDAIEHSGDGLALMDLWNSADEVILVDAMVSGREAGTILSWDPIAMPLSAPGFRCSTHIFGPAEAIELARVMDRLPRKLRIYGIEGANFSPGAEPGEQVRAAVEQVVTQIR